MIDKVPDSPNTSVMVGPLRLKRNNSEPFDGLRCSTVLEASTTAIVGVTWVHAKGFIP